MMKKALLVMAKRPSPGQTKTRLTPALTPGEAAGLYACFLQDVLKLAQSVPGVTPLVAVAPPDEETAVYFRELAPGMKQIPQVGMSLNERLAYVLTHCFHLGFEQVAAMNSDSPTLPSAYLTQAFARLDDPTTDVVLGPCDDGGYYLIGWKRPYPQLVRDVSMSTPHVLKDTLTIAAAANLHVSLLPPWYDVDSAADLRRVLADLAASPDAAPQTRQLLKQKSWPFLKPQPTP